MPSIALDKLTVQVQRFSIKGEIHDDFSLPIDDPSVIMKRNGIITVRMDLVRDYIQKSELYQTSNFIWIVNHDDGYPIALFPSQIPFNFDFIVPFISRMHQHPVSPSFEAEISAFKSTGKWKDTYSKSFFAGDLFWAAKQEANRKGLMLLISPKDTKYGQPFLAFPSFVRFQGETFDTAIFMKFPY